MITVSVLYPAGGSFDFNYYMSRHIPMVRQLLGPALKEVLVEKGVSGGAPGAPLTYQVLCHLRFESVESFQQAFAPHAAAIQNDIANYTSAQPVIQLSEIHSV